MNNKPKVVILGATGMLGSGVYSVLKDRYDLILTARDKNKIELLDKAYGGVSNHEVVEFDAGQVYQEFLEKKGYPGAYFQAFLEKIRQADWVINAIGITIPFSLENQALTFFINGALPHLLSRELGTKLIHITTDCVFNGQSGAPYDEHSPKTPVDLYGLSKSLGEPKDCLTIRTSIIGRELEGFTGLLEWFLNNKEPRANGFTNHFWNGVTTREFGRICDRLMSGEVALPGPGLYHVFSTSVSKYEMLLKLKDKYQLATEIQPFEAPVAIDRRLATVFDLNTALHTPSFDGMLRDL
jgi:dTDP-4-dehydrorhamnose reductase